MRLSFQKLEHMNSRYKLYYEEKPIERVLIERVGWDTSPALQHKETLQAFQVEAEVLRKRFGQLTLADSASHYLNSCVRLGGTIP